jgi:hypothetical protein
VSFAQRFPADDLGPFAEQSPDNAFRVIRNGSLLGVWWEVHLIRRAARGPHGEEVNDDLWGIVHFSECGHVTMILRLS